MKNLIAILILTICAISCKNGYNHKNNELILKELKYKSIERENERLKDIIINSIDKCNTKITDNLSFTTSCGDTVFLEEYISRSKTLILYPGSNFCASCLSRELSVLNQFASNLNQGQIIVLAQNISRRELIIEKQKNKYNFEVGIINNTESLNLEDRPIYFTLNNDLLITEIFYPIRNMENFSKRYLQSVSKKWEL